MFSLLSSTVSQENTSPLPLPAHWGGASYAYREVPEDLPYARIALDGNVVATITNDGYVRSRDALARRLRPLLAHEDTLCGPELAQCRAERIAQAIGGTILRAETAQSQHDWHIRPIAHWRIDHLRMELDGYRVPQEYRTARFRDAEHAAAAIRALMDYQNAMPEA